MYTIKPESEYSLLDSVGYKYFYNQFQQNNTITGLIIGIVPELEQIIVKLSNTVTAVLPWKEATLYNFSWFENSIIPKEISSLFLKKIRCKITSCSPSNITLSRKANMLMAWEKAIKPNIYLNAKIVAAMESGIFYDVGEGLTAFCRYKDYSLCRFSKDDIEIGATDYVSIQNISENYRLDISRKMADSSNYYQYKQFDIVKIRIANPIFKNGILTGAFAEIAPNVSGILDMSTENYIQTSSSTIVQAIIIKIDQRNKKIKLRLI